MNCNLYSSFVLCRMLFLFDKVLLICKSRVSVDSVGPNDCYCSGARFTKYFRTILRLFYDNAKVTVDLRRTSKLPNILQRMQGFSWVRFTCKIVRLPEIVFVN